MKEIYLPTKTINPEPIALVNRGNIHLLTPGTSVTYNCYDDYVVSHLVYGFQDSNPLVVTECGILFPALEMGVKKWSEDKRPLKVEFIPDDHCFYSGYGGKCYTPIHNFIFNILFNKYGHRTWWKDTLYDIPTIGDLLGLTIREGSIPNTKVLRKKVIALASKNKIKRKEYIKLVENAANWDYDDFAQAELEDRIRDEERSRYSVDDQLTKDNTPYRL